MLTASPRIYFSSDVPMRVPDAGVHCLASLDLFKAFDSVSHDSITGAMRRVRLDSRFAKYIRTMYANAGTFIGREAKFQKSHEQELLKASKVPEEKVAKNLTCNNVTKHKKQKFRSVVTRF